MFVVDKNISTNGAFFIGIFYANFVELKTIFGSPTHEDEVDGTTTEWHLSFKKDDAVTIYDVHNKHQNLVRSSHTYGWHVGSTSYRAGVVFLEWIEEKLHKHRG